MTFDPALIIIVALVCMIIGLSKGGLSPALAVIAAPLLAAVMPVKQALSLTLPLLLIGDAFALYTYWRQWDWRYMRLLLPAAIIGIIVGAYVLANLPDQTIRQMVGIIIVLFVLYRLYEPRLSHLRYQARDWHGIAAGWIAGAGSMVANVGGPPFTMYMLLQDDVSPQIFTGTATLFFAVVNLVKLPFLGLANIFDINDLLQNLWAVLFIPLGVLAGRYLVKRIDRKAFDYLMLAALILSAGVLLFVPPR
jgi:uncharacterized membrane protein YfcA